MDAASDPRPSAPPPKTVGRPRSRNTDPSKRKEDQSKVQAAAQRWAHKVANAKKSAAPRNPDQARSPLACLWQSYRLDGRVLADHQRPLIPNDTSRTNRLAHTVLFATPQNSQADPSPSGTPSATASMAELEDTGISVLASRFERRRTRELQTYFSRRREEQQWRDNARVRSDARHDRMNECMLRGRAAAPEAEAAMPARKANPGRLAPFVFDL